MFQIISTFIVMLFRALTRGTKILDNVSTVGDAYTSSWAKQTLAELDLADESWESTMLMKAGAARLKAEKEQQLLVAGNPADAARLTAINEHLVQVLAAARAKRAQE